MKSLLLFFFFCVLLAGYTFWQLETQQPELPPPEAENPAHPGWMEQWRRMKLAGQPGAMNALKAARAAASEAFHRQQAGRSGSLLQDITELGPNNVGGRVRAMVIDWANTNHILAAGISGGLWVTYDAGVSWAPVNDDANNLSITYITQSPFEPGVYYYSTGEPTGNSAGIPGNGIYKSIDSGQTFTKLPASDTSIFDYTWRIEHSLVDSQTVYVGTRSRGLWRSIDGGQSFHLVFNNGNRPVTDIAVFADSSVVVAVDNRGIFRSDDGSPNSFLKLSNGLPLLDYQRIELDYCDSVPAVMYAAYENDNGNGLMGFFKTEDGGASWDTVTNPDSSYRFSFPWYCLTVAVHPEQPDVVLAGSVELGYSLDGGLSWREAEYSHADHHIARFVPGSPNTIYNGNDGGVYSYNINTMSHQVIDRNNGLNVTQFYTGAYFPSGIKLYGGTQDNGTQATRNANPAFEHIFGGDGAFTAVNQQLPTMSYVSYQRGNVFRTDNADMISPFFYDIKNELDSDGDGDVDDGAWFINPFDVNPVDGQQLYFVTRLKVWRSIVGGMFWEPVTGVISTLDGSRPYCVGITPAANPTVYIGGARGLFYRVDSAVSTTPGDEVNLSGSVPDSLQEDFIVNITVHPQFDSVVYVSFSNYTHRSRLYKVTAANTSQPVWKDISAGIPDNVPVNWCEVHPLNDSMLYAATDFGLYTTCDGGQTWTVETAIPNVSIHMLALRPTDGMLFIYTHGRGIWSGQLPGNFSVGLETAAPKQVHVYPNPARSQLSVAGIAPGTHYQIITNGGRILRQGVYRNHIDIAALPAGQYFILLPVASDKQAKVGRFVKY